MPQTWPELQALIGGGETLQLEFKSERQASFNDRDLTAAVVCLANCEGGLVIVGVEDAGEVTGARHRHAQITDLNRTERLVRLVAERKLSRHGMRRWTYYSAGDAL